MAKTVVLTGASSGFGKLALILFLKRGHRVTAGLRGGAARLGSLEFASPEDSKLVRDAVASGQLRAVDLHMERPESFADVSALVERELGGKLDVLVNNAGYGLLGPLEGQTESQLRHQFDVNFFGPMLLTQRLLPALRAARGRILNLSSVGGFVTFPYYGAYHASKFALEGYSESLYYELKPFGVQVGLIEPGGFRTEFAGRSMTFSDGAKDPASPYYRRTRAIDEALRTKGQSLSGDPMRVAKLIVRLAERRRVPIRSQIGPDARLMAILKKLVPDGVRVAFEDLFFRLAVFRD